MITVTVSSKFQVVIPKEIREATDLQVGTKLAMIPYGNRIELVPVQPIASLRALLKGINTDIARD
jgi:AbrB family looped-hinge helix DNA binding protein